MSLQRRDACSGQSNGERATILRMAIWRKLLMLLMQPFAWLRARTRALCSPYAMERAVGLSRGGDIHAVLNGDDRDLGAD